MFDALYEVRPQGDKYVIVHIRSGQTVERNIRYRSYAIELCRRYNDCV
jgi:hypothetical protein